MSETTQETARKWAGFSESVGLSICVLGVVSGFNSVLNSGELGGYFGTADTDHGVLSDRGRRATADRCRAYLTSGDR